MLKTKKGNMRTMAILMSLILILCNNVIALAADDSANMAESMEMLSDEETINSGVSLYSGTHYFIPDTRFTFTGIYATSFFNVPKGCNLRYMVGAVASDKQIDYVYVDIINGNGKTVKSITVPTNEAKVYELGYISSGQYYLKVTSSRITVSYTYMHQLYTWDY